MQKIIEQRLRPELHELEGYVRDALGVAVRAKPWSEANRLPPFLRERYRFAHAELLNINALFAIDTKPEEESPATVRKHLDTVQAKQHLEVIYAPCAIPFRPPQPKVNGSTASRNGYLSAASVIAETCTMSSVNLSSTAISANLLVFHNLVTRTRAIRRLETDGQSDQG